MIYIFVTKENVRNPIDGTYCKWKERKSEKVYEIYLVDTSILQGRLTVAGGRLKGTKAIVVRLLNFELVSYGDGMLKTLVHSYKVLVRRWQ